MEKIVMLIGPTLWVIASCVAAWMIPGLVAGIVGGREDMRGMPDSTPRRYRTSWGGTYK